MIMLRFFSVPVETGLELSCTGAGTVLFAGEAIATGDLEVSGAAVALSMGDGSACFDGCWLTAKFGALLTASDTSILRWVVTQL